jgi:Fe-S cluster assembly iron-binding protein IscA
MLNVTDAAASHLHEMLWKAKEEVKAPEETAIRLQRSGEGSLGFVLDKEREGDNKASFAGATVLLLDETLAQELTGQTLDVVETDRGRTFSLR